TPSDAEVAQVLEHTSAYVFLVRFVRWNALECARGGHKSGHKLNRGRISAWATCWKQWWAGTGLNRRHQDFQSCALPTELPAHHEVARIPDGVGSVQRNRTRWGEEAGYLSGRSAPVSDSKTI